MEIKDILDSLGLDFSNPETRRGAVEAIEAILNSRAPALNADLGAAAGGGETDVELDPDLIQPSVKQPASASDDADIEVEDEEHILDQIKHNESEDDIEDNTSGKEDSSDEDSDAEGNDADGGASDNNSGSSSSEKEDTSEPDKNDKSENSDDTEKETDETDFSKEENEDDSDNISDENDDEDSDEAENSGEVDSEPEDDGFDDDESEYDDEDDDEDDEESNIEDSDFDDETDGEVVDSENDDKEEFEFDEDDLLDDETADSLEDKESTSKLDSRKIKRERTIEAAKKTLADARARKVAPSLIAELEKAIEALESLTEAVSKSIKDLSDDEFNQIVGRVFDAIDAIGGSDLTYTSGKEREIRAQEIKADLEKAETQNELSAEDIAQIRADHQTVKAREKEAAKFASKARGSFKGFQDFLNSLYRAIALQVTTEENREDSWAALSRRNNGDGVLQQGQKVQELSNKKIPVIDFYFDCSASWDPSDIEVGKKAVAALADMEKDGRIKVNIYYFSDEVSEEYEEVADGGTSAWNYIVKNIITTQATNVVIMTDGDMESQGRFKAGASGHLQYTVPGYVWYLWKDGENAPRLPRDLKGRGGVQQFSFSAADV